MAGTTRAPWRSAGRAAALLTCAALSAGAPGLRAAAEGAGGGGPGDRPPAGEPSRAGAPPAAAPAQPTPPAGGPAPAADGSPPATSTPDAVADLPTALEGVALGDSLRALSWRLQLGDQVPAREGATLRYDIDTQRTLPSSVRDDLLRRHVSRMELEFRQDRLATVKVEYSDRRDTTFPEMEAEMSGRYGPPSRTQKIGPLQVGREKGVRLYLWIRQWVWEGSDRVLTVEGQHYGDEKEKEVAKRHAYSLKLEEKTEPL